MHGDDASWRALGIILTSREEWETVELAECMQVIGSEFEMLEFVEVEQDVPLSEAIPDLPKPLLTNERAAWESFRMLLWTKEKWKTRDLADRRTHIELEFQIGTVGKLIGLMGEEA
jgi:hypothetical protein